MSITTKPDHCHRPAEERVGPTSGATRRRLRWLAAVTAAILTVGLLPPVAIADPVPPVSSQPVPTPTAPKKAAGDTAPVPAVDSRLIQIMTPLEGTLVTAGSWRVEVKAPLRLEKFRATLGGRDVTKQFRRNAHSWTATIRHADPGTQSLQISGWAGRKFGKDQVRLTVARHRRVLLTGLPSTSGDLRHAADPGVAPVAFRADPRAVLSARLNGRPLTLSPAQGNNLHTEVLSRADGLRAGSNLLQVQAFLDNGDYQLYRVPLQVPTVNPMAEAGTFHQALRPGQQAMLDARTSAAGVRGNRVDYQWRVVAAPKGAAGAFTAQSSPRTRFVPSKPGRYVLAVTVVERRRNGRPARSTDLVRLTAAATPPPIGESITTLAPDPTGASTQLGLQKGTTWSAWLKPEINGAGIYAFDRTSLAYAVKANNDTIVPGGIGTKDPDGDIKTFLTPVSKGDLIVVMGRSGCCGSASKLLPKDGAFSYIFSYDGDPAHFGNDGTWNKNLELGTLTSGPAAAGSLTGYLRYQLGDPSVTLSAGYRFVQDDGVAFDTLAPSVATGAPDDGSVYRVTTPDGGQAVTGVMSAADNGSAPVTMKDRGADPLQQWELVRAYGEFYKMVNHRNGTCLDVAGGDPTSSTTVQQYQCDPNGPNQTNQLWLVIKDTSGAWLLQSALTSKPALLTRQTDGTLRIGDQLPADQNLVQRWALNVPPGIYTITNGANRTAVAEPDSTAGQGDQLIAGQLTGDTTQQWQLTDEPDGTFALRNIGSGLCLDITANGTTDNVPIGRWTCHADQADGTNQRWTAQAFGEVAQLLSPGSNLQLDTQGGKLRATKTAGTDVRVNGWQLNRLPDPVPNGTYALVQAFAGQRLDLVGPKPQGVAVSNPMGSPGWTLRDRGDNLVQLDSDGKCLTNTGTEDGEVFNVEAGDCGAGGTQWRLQPQPDGTTKITSADVAEQPTLNIGPDGVVTAVADDSADQTWLLSGQSVTFQINQQRYTTALPILQGGFTVMAVDAAMRPVSGYPANYPTSLRAPLAATQYAANQQLELAEDLDQLAGTAGVTVMVQTAGRPTSLGDGFNRIADSLEKLGADRSLFLHEEGPADDPKGDYTFTGCAGCSQLTAVNESVRHTADPTVTRAHMSGTLQRNAQSVLSPRLSTPGLVDSSLNQILQRPTTAWAYTDQTALLNNISAYVQRQVANTSGGFPASCPNTAADAVRAAYCYTGSNTNDPWPQRRNALAKMPLPATNQNTFKAVRNQLDAEWAMLSNVRTLMSDIRSIIPVGSDDKNSADMIAKQIQGLLSADPADNSPGLGGFLDGLAAGYSFLKDFVELAPVVVATKKSSNRGGDLAEEPSNDTEESGLALLAVIISAALDNRDGSPGAVPEIRADASHYADALAHQNTTLLLNLSTVENLIVSDPDKLRLAGINAAGPWTLTGTQVGLIEDALAAGTKRDLWNHLLPATFELWNFPSIASGYRCDQIASEAQGIHYIFEGQDPRACFYPVVSLNGQGQADVSRTFVLTPQGHRDVYKIVSRVANSSVVGPFYDQTGYAPTEVPATGLFPVATFPQDLLYVAPNRCNIKDLFIWDRANDNGSIR